ncbi:MAG: hypothetical protein QNJ94_07560 [Alphaproteobacteria bacterium]|nr:hypothetical protein [Alphaproteobacteria bacterium]
MTNPIRTILTSGAVAVVLVAAALPAIAAGKSKTKHLYASRDQVRAACEAQGGSGWGYNANSGRYGCISNDGWIECDSDGDCAGGRADRRPAASGGSAAGQTQPAQAQQ